MKIIRDILILSSEYLKKKGDPYARRHSEIIISHILQCQRMDLYLRFEEPIEEAELTKIREKLVLKATGQPVEYIIGSVMFYDLDLFIDSRVLIPRPETEIFASMIDKEIKEERVMWDLCTGSGCLGLSLKSKRPELEVSLSDLSEDALAVARRNAKYHELDVKLYLGDLLAPFQGQRADIIICNPPYISEAECSNAFEPHMALISGATGLECYERLACDLPEYLNPDAKLFFEIGASQGADLMRIFNGSHWKKKSCLEDWSGHDRFFLLEFQGKGP